MHPGYLRFLAALGACLLGISPCLAPPSLARSPAESRPSAESHNAENAWTLRSTGGDTYRGTMAASSQGDHLEWRSPSFLAPLQFPWSAVEQLERHRTDGSRSLNEIPLPPHLFHLETHAGIELSGQLLSTSTERIRLDVPGLGVREIPTSDIRHLLSINSSSNHPVQVLESDAWEQVLPAPKNGRATKWFLKAGEISTDTSGTTISQWATLPELATIDVEVAWEQASVNWWLTIGEPRRMELQVRKLQNKNLLNVTLLVENSKDADVATVQLPYTKEQSISLKLLCDANKGMYAIMHNDRVLGRIKGNPAERIVGRTKFSFTNTSIGVLTLRDLRISSRPFAIPSETIEGAGTLAEILTRTRGTFFGTLEPTDSSESLKIRSANDTLLEIGFDELERIEFPAPSADNPPRDSHPPTLRVELTNGLRFASSTVRSQPGATDSGREDLLGLQLAFGDSFLTIPMRDVERIVASRNGYSHQDTGPPNPSNNLRLITEDVVSVGRVESVFTADDGSRTFTWLPQWGAKSAPINPTSDGAIEPIHAAPALTPKKSGSSSQSDGVIRRNDPPNHEAHFGRELKPNDPSLFLVSGDCFPGKFLSGNQESVEFQSPFFQKSTLPSHWVRGIRVVDLVGGDAVDRATRNRILTLPRMQRKNPPTHLVVARDGDVLRGQLISFDRDQLLLEVRGEVRTLQVKNIAEIVWLEPTPPTDADTDESAAKATFTDSPPALQSQGLYQVILEQGSRVSIAPDRVDAESLSGSHPVLGQCTLPWSNITRLVLGNAIRIDSARSRFGKWKLQNAADPKFVNEGSDQANDAPSDTAQDRLMGQPAPDFDLAKIDGTPCRLADYRGNVLILDFWASWCGPCIQSMPRMLEISREYRDLGVELVLVNVEETEDRVRVFLEKREIMPTVALDTDGSIAKQFAVQAIPQTVVIDRDGTIAKILVGAGEENETELLRVLDELTARQKTK